jgi:predicted transcriptional regulator of viral defense system
MWTKTLASQSIRLLARERRRVVADWRILLLCRRASHGAGAPLPDSDRAAAVIRHLLNAGDLASIEGVQGVYTVQAAFASILAVSEEEIIQEAHPWAVFSHLTALARHRLTDEIPRSISATSYSSRGGRLPLGTTPEEWTDIEWPRPRRPRSVEERSVIWTQSDAAYDFGTTIDYARALPIYVTDSERTLLDAIRRPDKSGGITVVFQAWARARDDVDLDRLTDYAEKFDSPLMRQRVGFLCERLDLHHPRFGQWKKNLRRGSSMKLHPSEPFSSEFSEEWSLSLNVLSSLLDELDQE